LIVISGTQVILSQQADVLIVGTFLETGQAAVYAAAIQLATLVGFGTTAILFLALPMIADFHAQHRVEDLQKLVFWTVRGSAVVAVPAFLVMAFAGNFLLSWYGTGFTTGTAALRVLAFMNLVGAVIGGLAGFLMTMTGHERQAAVVMIGTAALNVLLWILLTPRFGIVGTASATAVAGVARTAILCSMVRRFLSVRVWAF
jgi:O-antigen/teichoic acid export membrane protein